MGTQDNTAQKKLLNQQITDKKAEITKCKDIKRELQTEKGKLEKYQKKWENQHQKHTQSRIASKVVIKNVFEGTIADKLKKYYGDQVKNMCKTQKEAADLCKELDSQIQKLDTHMKNLQGEVTEANTKLKGLEE